MNALLKRFKYCDKRFFPYLEKVLERLPEDIRERVLDDNEFQILAEDGFLSAKGRYCHFEKCVKGLVYLNTQILKEPERNIIHTVAHEIAHWIAGRGSTGLNEKEAEDLLVAWGFKEESEAVKYHRPILESEGYKMGYEWAKQRDEQDLLERFEEYYDEWDQDKLSGERLEAFFYDFDPTSILAEMGALEESVQPTDLQPAEDENIGFDGGSVDKGIAWGAMAVVKEILLRRQSMAYQSDEGELVEALRLVHNGLKRLFSFSMWNQYFEEVDALAVSDLYVKIDEVLEKTKTDTSGKFG